MAGKSNIEWTDATWNPIVGCSIVSPGCTNCYAMKMAARMEAMAGTCAINPDDARQTYYGMTKKVNGNAVWTGKVCQAPDHILLEPLKRKKPTIYFVNSMGDLFHESIPDEWIDKVFAVMALCPQHTFQVLTKRAERMRAWIIQDRKRSAPIECIAELYVGNPEIAERWPFDQGRAIGVGVRGWPLPNVWLGVSCERQQEADERIPHLLQTPAAVRFISAEPLLGPIDLTAIEAPEKVEGERWTFDALSPGDYYTQHSETMLGEPRRSGGDGPQRDHALDWIIAGGESGSKARPMHPDWARSLRDQCAVAGVPFFFKQWGGWQPHRPQTGDDLGGDVRAGRVRIVHPTGQSDVEVSIATGGRSTIVGSRYMMHVGKKKAGRLLDGKEHNEFPEFTK